MGEGRKEGRKELSKTYDFNLFSDKRRKAPGVTVKEGTPKNTKARMHAAVEIAEGIEPKMNSFGFSFSSSHHSYSVATFKDLLEF